MTASPITILSNPQSTGNRRDGAWASRVMASEPGIARIEAATPEAVTAAVRRSLASEILVIDGGDGTADLVFGALIEAGPGPKPKLFIAPSGKTNMTAAAWCGGRSAEASLRRVLDLRRTGGLIAATHDRTILRIDRGSGQSTLFGAFLGAADVVDGILMCRRSIYPLGLPNAISHAAAIAIMSWRALLGGSNNQLHAAWPDGGGESGAYLFAGVTTLDRLIVGLAPEPDGGDGALIYMSLASGPRALATALPSALAQRIDAGVGRTVRRVARATLKFTGAYTVDGELYETDAATPIDVSAAGPLPVIKLPEP